MTKFPIETGVPSPIDARFPFYEMRIGDSFLIPNASNEELVALAQAITQMKKEGDGRTFFNSFITRHVPEGIRCWRTK